MLRNHEKSRNVLTNVKLKDPYVSGETAPNSMSLPLRETGLIKAR